MKKFSALLLAAALILSLAGCTGTAEDETADSAADQTVTEAANDTDSETVQETNGYVFEYNGVSVVIDAQADPIIEALGEYKSYYEAASCAFEGLDKIYTYTSFEIDTYPTDDVDYISAVILKDDLVSTAEGVAIGDSLEKVTETYGEGTDESGYLVYEKDEMKLRFVISDDTVTSIEYQTMVLD